MLISVLAFHAYGQTVSTEEAKQVALHFINSASENSERATERSVIQIIPYIEQQVTLYYAVNMEPASYVLISADKSARPIIGYSKNRIFNDKDENPAFNSFMARYRAELKDTERKKPSAQNQNLKYWEKWLSNDASTADRGGTVIVGPLLTTKWNQTQFYNDWCPADANAPNGYGGHVPTGCVATAMAQVMRYYKYPNFGTDAHEYWHGAYGTQAADFYTHYNWSQMPDQLNAPNTEVAKLIRHCGVGVNMDYGPQGSSAWNTAIPFVLDHFFGYDAPAYTLLGFNGENIVKEELHHLRPVIYSACEGVFGQSGCHTWVCDGYEIDAQGFYYFHMNWGWGGLDEDYYTLSDLTPGDDNYSNWHTAITHIVPKSCLQNYNHAYNFLPIMNMETVGEITASATISSLFGLPVLFDAGSYIQLNPGTNIGAGTVFSTKIEGCGNADGSDFSGNGNEGRSQQQTDGLAKSTEVSIFPNPFIASTTIAYELPNTQTVDIKIFNAVGNLVAQPVRQEQQDTGPHEYTFEANGLPNGVYFLVMQTGDQKLTKRIVLAK